VGGNVSVAATFLVALAGLTASQAPVRPLPPPTQHTVLATGHPLAVWSRAPAAPTSTIVLVHGRTWSSRPDFDLRVPGLQRSVMASLATRGFAVYAVDLRGYGASPRDRSGFLTPSRAAADVVAVLHWVAARHPSLPPPALLGWSLGGAVAQLAVHQPAAPVSALVLFGYAMDPTATIAHVPAPDRPAMVETTRADAEFDFVSPQVTPRAVVDAFVQQALASDPVRVDWTREDEFNAMKASTIRVPTLVIHGARDPGLAEEVTARFVAALGTPHRQWTILPGADHAAQLEDTHEAFVDAVAGFLLRPGPVRRRPEARE
jgi:pimeloyl-ACP methyl ester carboxylesterase